MKKQTDTLEYFKNKFEMVEDLNKKMVSIFINNNKMFDIIDDKNSSDSEKEKASDVISLSLCNIYSLLLEYANKCMNMNSSEFSREWLEKNITDDDSYIQAEKNSSVDNPISVSVIERESYIQPIYIDSILKIQGLVKSEASKEDILNFYDYDLENIIGIAKMLMYHSEDLEDLISIYRLKNIREGK